MTGEELLELKALAAKYFSIVTLMYHRQKYRDELQAELQRIDSELEVLDAQYFETTKEIGALLLKALTNADSNH